MHQRTVDDWDMQRYQLEMEYHDLLSRIESLSEEVVLPSVSFIIVIKLNFLVTTIGRPGKTVGNCPAVYSPRCSRVHGFDSGFPNRD
jgi:hypothetical protein